MDARDDAQWLDRYIQQMRRPPRSVSNSRYVGDDHAVRISEMTQGDGEATRALYTMLVGLDAVLRAMHDDDDPAIVAASFDLDRALACARSLGVDDSSATRTRQVLHDVRGGALTSLLVEVQRARSHRAPVGARSLKILTTAHLKVMRNAVLGLDDVRRARDFERSPHSVERLSEALEGVTFEGSAGSVAVAVNRTFDGDVTTSCMELGALDRAALNLVNNAVRHAASTHVEVALFSTTGERSGDLGICVANPIAAPQARLLRDRFGDDLRRIFIEPFSTTGSGEGLKICTAFVAAAYGLVTHEDALGLGLVGAEVRDDRFVGWMHWPAIV